MDDVLALIGDPRKVDEELQSFRKTALKLSSDAPRMIEKYNGKWVALHSGLVRAHGDSLESVLEIIDKKGFSRKQAVVRYITDEPRKFLL